jgi:hypothetical protein
MLMGQVTKCNDVKKEGKNVGHARQEWRRHEKCRKLLQPYGGTVGFLLKGHNLQFLFLFPGVS